MGPLEGGRARELPAAREEASVSVSVTSVLEVEDMTCRFPGRLLLAAALFGTAGCKQVVEVDLRPLPFPVLVGPVRHIGPAGQPSPPARLISRVEGEASSLVAGGGGTTTQHAYGDVYETRTTTVQALEVSNSILQNFSREVHLSPSRAVILDRIKAVTFAHLSIFGYRNTYIAMGGEVWDHD